MEHSWVIRARYRHPTDPNRYAFIDVIELDFSSYTEEQAWEHFDAYLDQHPDNEAELYVRNVMMRKIERN